MAELSKCTPGEGEMASGKRGERGREREQVKWQEIREVREGRGREKKEAGIGEVYI